MIKKAGMFQLYFHAKPMGHFSIPTLNLGIATPTIKQEVILQLQVLFRWLEARKKVSLDTEEARERQNVANNSGIMPIYRINLRAI